MAESSRFWATNGTGDGPSGGYTAALFNEFLRHLFHSVVANEAVLFNVGGNLAVTGTSSPVSVATGSALVYGFFYTNDSAINVTVPTPTSATRVDRIVLRASWSSQTVRVVRIAGVEGSGVPPALTQNAGSTWEVSLARVSITTGGVITVTDERKYIKSPAVYGWFAEGLTLPAGLAVTGGSVSFPANTINGSAIIDGTITGAKIAAGTISSAQIADGGIGTSDLADNAVTTSKVADSSITTAKLGNGAATTDKIANDAVTTAKLADGAATNTKLADNAVTTAKLANGAVTSAKLADNAVTTAKVVDDAIDIAKIGQRVLALPNRQGGSGTDWSAWGGTNYTPTHVRIQVGSNVTDANGLRTITFPSAFSQIPLVFIQSVLAIGTVQSISTTGFTVATVHPPTLNALPNTGFFWLAIGAE